MVENSASIGTIASYDCPACGWMLKQRGAALHYAALYLLEDSSAACARRSIFGSLISHAQATVNGLDMFVLAPSLRAPLGIVGGPANLHQTRHAGTGEDVDPAGRQPLFIAHELHALCSFHVIRSLTDISK